MNAALQGWNPDPFGRFEHRYFSDGSPTPLVRTGSVESRDEPGDRPPEPRVRPTLRADTPARLRPHLYARREHRFRTAFTLGIAFVIPLLVWELLVTTASERIFGVVAFAVVCVLVAILVRVSRVPRPQRRRRPPGTPTLAS